MGDEYSVTFIAKLTAGLPAGSRTLARINPKSEFTITDWLLLGILNAWRDKPLDPFAPPKESRVISKSQDEMAEILSRPRKAVK